MFFQTTLPGSLHVVAKACRLPLAARYPGLAVAGVYSPPFCALTAEENRHVVATINVARADIVWVGLSTPKQERWMFEHRDQLRVPVLVGVGAAFDFHTGRTMQAPTWMRENGLEWLFRLIQEPRRLWRRYLVYGSELRTARNVGIAWLEEVSKGA